MRLGIDFGTTHTVVAAVDRGNYPVLPFEDVHGDAHEFFPSVVAARAGEWRFGWAAAAVAGERDWHVLRSFKRLLAGPGVSGRRTVELGALRTNLSELLVGYLSALRAALPDDGSAHEAVIAVPANAHGMQRLLTWEAFRAAGFDVKGIVNEPSAAGFEYTHRHRKTLNAKRDRIVVYDLGGGTFDASLVRMSGRTHEVLTTAGLNHLGGDDFDAVLLRLVLDRAVIQEGSLDPGRRAKLLDACRLAKETLNPNSRKVSVELEPGPDGGEADVVTIPAADFYEACTPLTRATIEAMQPVMGKLAEDEAGASDDLAGLYVVGGATGLPGVMRDLREVFGRRVHRSPHPFAAVAIGLAIAADKEAGYELKDRLSRHLGVFRESQAGSEVVFDTLVHKDTALPSDGSTLALTRRYVAAHNVGHYRFAECGAVDDHGLARGDLTPLTDVRFAFDPSLREVPDLRAVEVRRLGRGPQVEERYEIDPTGRVELTLTDLDHGYARTFTLAGDA